MKLTFAVAALLCAAPSIAAPAETVERVIDGDTFVLAAKWSPYPLKWQIRVLGIDTPEKGRLAKCPEEAAHSEKATALAKYLLKQAGGKVLLTNVKHDKYGGRLNANVTITIQGKKSDFADLMISGGYALPYLGEGPKPDWCAITKGQTR
jgi:endonuclease YncB( thermonuclease family)